MADLEIDFQKGNYIVCTKDIPALGLKTGTPLPLEREGESIISGPLSWTPSQLTEEIKQGVWMFLYRAPN